MVNRGRINGKPDCQVQGAAVEGKAELVMKGKLNEEGRNDLGRRNGGSSKGMESRVAEVERN